MLKTDNYEKYIGSVMKQKHLNSLNLVSIKNDLTRGSDFDDETNNFSSNMHRRKIT